MQLNDLNINEENDSLLPRKGTILARGEEYPSCVTLRVTSFEKGGAWQPGQFFMVTVPGRGEVPISVSGGDSKSGYFDLTIVGVGPVTRALCELGSGQSLGLRGPYGRGWPINDLRGTKLLLVAGGVGIAPLRAALQSLIADDLLVSSVTTLLGVRTHSSLLFLDELERGATDDRIKVKVIVAEGSAEWAGPIGVVTDLIDDISGVDLPDTVFLCGPEPMMIRAAGLLIQRGIGPHQIYLALERSMHCGVGWCGRCQLGPFLLCRDGPVLSWDRVSRYLLCAEV